MFKYFSCLKEQLIKRFSKVSKKRLITLLIALVTMLILPNGQFCFRVDLFNNPIEDLISYNENKVNPEPFK